MNEKIGHFYEFGEFCLDVSNRLLLRDGQVVPLKPKVVETLLFLVQNKGRVVGKSELLDALWKDTFVEEGNLTQNIYLLRKALSDESSESLYIETIPKRGYRFVAPVKEIFEADADSETAFSNLGFVSTNDEDARKSAPDAGTSDFALPAAPEKRRFGYKPLLFAALILTALIAAMFYWRAIQNNETKEATKTENIKTIAVLPFNSLNPAESNDALLLGTGMADALITKLSSVKNLKVLPTGAVLKYSNQNSDPITSARQLSADYVLDGKIQRSGDSIRVTAQLIRTADGATLWAEQFDRNFTDVFAVQDSISEQAARALTSRLNDEEQKRLRRHYTENAAAYEAYLKGRFFWNKRTVEGFNKGIEYFEQAIKIDPNYALAYAGLADCFMRLNDRGVSPSEGTLPRAKAAVLKALEFDDSLAEAHATLGFINFRFEWDFAAAEREFKRAVELDPNYAIAHQWYAFYLLTMNREQNALAELNRAREIEPLSLNLNSGFGTYFYFTRQYDKSAEQFQKTIEMDANFAEAHWILSLVYEQQGKYQEAEREFKNLQDSSGDNTGIAASLAHLYATMGKTTEARRILNDLQEKSKQKYVSPYDIAVVFAGLGDSEQALSYLEKAYGERALRPAWLKFDPRLDVLRAQSRFQVLLGRIE